MFEQQHIRKSIGGERECDEIRSIHHVKSSHRGGKSSSRSNADASLAKHMVLQT